jgi:hypothetical protein
LVIKKKIRGLLAYFCTCGDFISSKTAIRAKASARATTAQKDSSRADEGQGFTDLIEGGEKNSQKRKDRN